MTTLRHIAVSSMALALATAAFPASAEAGEAPAGASMTKASKPAAGARRKPAQAKHKKGAPTHRVDEKGTKTTAAAPTASGEPATSGTATPTAQPHEGSAAIEPAATPLTLRQPPTKPLQLAEQPAAPRWWYKLLAAAAAALAGGWWFWRRNKRQPRRAERALRVLARTSLGMRSELVLVDVDGRQLLLGVTPKTIRRLGWLDGASTEPGEQPAAATQLDAPPAAPTDEVPFIHALEQATAASAEPASRRRPERREAAHAADGLRPLLTANAAGDEQARSLIHLVRRH